MIPIYFTRALLCQLSVYLATMSEGKFIVLKASAGSGKTYALVRYYLLLALRSDYPQYYRHILAITFTNAAAAEMKERVMTRLLEFSDEKHSSALAKDLCTELSISTEILRDRANRTYRDMLHHYSQISILTIDSFTHRIIRSFARDLHLSHDFRIEMDEERFRENLVDICLQQIGNDEELTTYLVEYVLDKIAEGKSWGIRESLIKTSKHIFLEETTAALKKLMPASLDDFARIRKRISADYKRFEDELIALAKPALEMLSQAGVAKEDFFNGGKGTYPLLKSILNRNLKEVPVKTFIELPNKDKWHSGKASQQSIELIQSLKPELLPYFIQITTLFTHEALSRYKLRKNILENLHAIGLLEKLSEYAVQLKQEENVILISDFQRIVNEVVIENDAPFIYERIGNRYKHILIDEFQDTSLTQWSNAIPLVANTLSENNLSLIVGDAKQSIYRWRGANVNQFVDLPKIPEMAGNQNAQLLFRSQINSDILDSNRRSALAIVEFNNLFYSFFKKQNDFVQKVFEDVHQNPTRNDVGYVCISKIKGPYAKDVRMHTFGFILQSINACIADGFMPGDIAILTRRGASEGGKVAEFLSREGFQVVTKDSFLLQNSPVVRIVMGFMTYHMDASRQFAAIDLVQSLTELNADISLTDFLQKYTTRSHRRLQLDLPAFLDTHFGEDRSFTTTANIYQFAADTMKYFGLSADNGIEFLLEKIKHQTIGKNMSVHEFITWWNDSKDSLYTTASENQDAINIMTIHKSKGLQYPVVIYPRFASKNNPDAIWVNLDEHEYGLPVAYAKPVSNAAEEIMPPEFDEESDRQFLDDLNLCYVATTRAEDRLYLIQEDTSARTKLSKKILEILDDHFSPFKQNGIWESGIPGKNTRKSKLSHTNTITFNSRSVAKKAPAFIPSKEVVSPEREYGRLLHMCIAEVMTKDDIQNAVRNVARLFGSKDEGMNERLEKDIRQMMSHEKASQWFTEDTITIREREICTANGMILRPDRVVIFPEKIDVIDFKTGEHKNEHEAQVKTYATYLSEMYALPVNCFLCYTSGPSILEVE